MTKLRKTILLLFAVVAFDNYAVGQNNDTTRQEEKDKKIYHVYETEPKFPGGMDSLYKYFKEKITYPDSAEQHGIEGVVAVKFIINKQGEVTKPRIEYGVCKALNKEALRVISSMPDWEPGTLNGEKIRIRYTIPLRFSLPDNDNDKDTLNRSIAFEQTPKFPGGKDSLFRYLKANIQLDKQGGKQPKSQRRKVVVKFRVSKKGKTETPEIIQSAFPQLDQKVMQVVKAMPRWEPAVKAGKKVRAVYVLPVNVDLID